jgi:hypothetical protein
MKIPFIPVLLVAVIGCGGPSQIEAPERPKPSELADNDRYEPARSGTIGGIVRWNGPTPTVEPVSIVGFQINQPLVARTKDNPNTPRIANGGLGSAFVRLDGVDPRRSRRMAPKSIDVRIDGDGIALIENGERKRIAWASVGSEIRLVNRFTGIAGIRARGSEFFSQLFPEADRESTRIVTQAGRTTFTSASGQYWAVADLFVSEHPYMANTDAEGRFRFDDVPDGEYELVAWHPHWRVAGHELDPETGVVARWRYAPAVEIRATVRVVAGTSANVNMAFQLADFKEGP